MANFPFKINIETVDGTQKSYFTSSFATDAETSVSASLMIDKINGLPLGQTYIQSIESTTASGSIQYEDSNEGKSFLSASMTHPNTGSIIFHDTETTNSQGLKFYTFWGTKVCTVLGLPEGIPIYPENFKLSDDSDDSSNYVSGDIISDAIAVKQGFKMAPQARMKSNIIWDEENGEGLVQWVSGSKTNLIMGYDDTTNKYVITADSGIYASLAGFDSLDSRNITGSISTSKVIAKRSDALQIRSDLDSSTGTLYIAGTTLGHTFQGANVTIEEILDITNTTDASDDTGDTGALRCEGGASIAKKLFVGSDLDVSGDLTAATITMAGKIDTSDEVEAAHLHSTDDIEVANDIFHSNDTDTKIAFTDDRIDIDAGGYPMIDIVENGTSSYIVFNQNANDVNFRVESSGETNMIKVDGGSDFMGIGTGTQDPSLPRLTVEQETGNFVMALRNTSTSDDSADGLMLRYSQTGDMDNGAHFFQVIDGDDDIQFEVRGGDNGSYSIGNSFTAGHDTACEDYDDMLPGMIVESTGEIWYKPILKTVETALPFTKLSDTNGSSTVFGVVGGYPVKYDASGSITNVPDYEQRYIKNGWCLNPAFTKYAKNAPTGSGNIHLNTMSIGEGVIWVTNINGEITNGDFIESSVIKGYGRKQNDDILRSKTVAKCTETINWSEVTSSIQYSGSAYKKYLAAATFHCG